MGNFLEEWFGTIAVLIYILYPLLKRWLQRRKQRQQPAPPPAPQQERAPAAPRAPATPRAPAQARPFPPPAPPPAEPPQPVDLVALASAQAARLEDRAEALLDRAEGNPRLVRLVPALREDLLGRIRATRTALSKRPPMSTVAQELELLRALDELLGYLHKMAEQRLRSSATMLGDADAMADACYAPILEFARSHGLELRTSTPVVVSGDWGLSIVPRFASTRVAPLRLPRGFGRSVWLWPAIAHEVAHDLYYSVKGLEEDLHRRVGLPRSVPAPGMHDEIDTEWLRQLFGAWQSEIFADMMGTLMLGPAYVETMVRAFANPASPQRTAAIFPSGAWIDEHPPERLRVYMATRVLLRLGRHKEADALWDRWEAEHPGVDFYFLPLAGQWVGLSDESMHTLADSTIDVLLDQSWPELADYRLLDIPGFAYLHAEHAIVEQVQRKLARGEVVDVDVRWIMAGAVLAVVADPESHEVVFLAASRSIIGVGARKSSAAQSGKETLQRQFTGGGLAAAVRDPSALVDAIILGEAFRPYRPPRTRRRPSAGVR